MTKQTTDAEKIHDLQTSLLWEFSQHATSATKRFVAFTAFTAENPIRALGQLRDGQHGSLPEPAGEWIVKSAAEVMNEIRA